MVSLPSRISYELGHGSWGTIYAVEDKPSIVLKVARNSEASFPSLSEIDILFRIKSPYLLSGDGIHLPGDFLGVSSASIAIERADGLVRDIAPDLHITEIGYLFSHYVTGIYHLHSNGYYHLDLSMHNLMYKRDPTYPYGRRGVVIDFGATLPFIPEQETRVTTTMSRTTCNYASPDAITSCARRDYIYSENSDIWALGCILYEMITGEILCKVELTAMQKQNIALLRGDEKDSMIRKMQMSNACAFLTGVNDRLMVECARKIQVKAGSDWGDLFYQMMRKGRSISLQGILAHPALARYPDERAKLTTLQVPTFPLGAGIGSTLIVSRLGKTASTHLLLTALELVCRARALFGDSFEATEIGLAMAPRLFEASTSKPTRELELQYIKAYEGRIRSDDIIRYGRDQRSIALLWILITEYNPVMHRIMGKDIEQLAESVHELFEPPLPLICTGKRFLDSIPSIRHQRFNRVYTLSIIYALNLMQIDFPTIPIELIICIANAYLVNQWNPLLLTPIGGRLVVSTIIYRYVQAHSLPLGPLQDFKDPLPLSFDIEIKGYFASLSELQSYYNIYLTTPYTSQLKFPQASSSLIKAGQAFV